MASQIQASMSKFVQSQENAVASKEKYRRLKEAASEEGAVAPLDLDTLDFLHRVIYQHSNDRNHRQVSPPIQLDRFSCLHQNEWNYLPFQRTTIYHL